MALNEEKFPQLIQQLYEIVDQLEKMFPGRPFTPDGHMVGSLAECYAKYYYGLKLYTCSNKGHDARLGESDIEIKATQGKYVSLRSSPEKLLVFQLSREGKFEEVYNGNGAPVWALVSHKPRPSNGQYRVSLAQLRVLMKSTPPEQRIARIRPQTGN